MKTDKGVTSVNDTCAIKKKTHTHKFLNETFLVDLDIYGSG